MEGARIYAQNAIRQKNQSMNYLRLSSRVDAVASRVESAVKMQLVTKQMAGVVKGMESSLQSMDVEKIARVMEGFEKSFEDVDVRSEYIEQAINSSTSAAMPEEDVENLLQQVADEHGLEFRSKMNQATPSSAPVEQAVASLPEAEEDKLAERLRRLREAAA
ncbi:charged multivesicular body protein 1b [Pavlovales sp. CCMP2436]|nr:charged multivesicular body protein 1b [Pavlovales sp. CCMP2436]